MILTRLMIAAGVAGLFSTSAALAGPQPVVPGVSAPSTSVVSGSSVATTRQPSGRLNFVLTPSR